MPILPRFVIPSQALEVGDPRLDSDIIHQPRPENSAQRLPRTPLASTLYPNLKLLPSERRDLMLPQRPQTNNGESCCPRDSRVPMESAKFRTLTPFWGGEV